MNTGFTYVGNIWDLYPGFTSGGDNSVSDEQTNALIDAVHDANLKQVEALLADGADANTCVNRPGSSIIPAVAIIHTEELSPLIAAIELLHPTTPHDTPACHPTTPYPSDMMMEIFDVLLNSVDDVNIPCPGTHRTPVMHAAAAGNVRCVEQLIYKGAALHTTDKFGEMVWTLAAKKGRLDVLRCLIEDHGIDKNSMNNKGFSMLYFAVCSRNKEVVRYLLNLGVTVASYVPQKRRAETCESCHQNIYRHSIYEMQVRGDPYVAAISKNVPEVVKLFEEHGCQLYQSDEVLSYAVNVNSVEVVEYLLGKHKYSLNNEYSGHCLGVEIYPHQTILMSACNEVNLKSIELLLEHGANPNMKRCADKCFSAINILIEYGRFEMTARLIRSGANVNTRFESAFTGVGLPFEVAVSINDTYEAEILLVYGSSCGVHSLKGKHKLKSNLHPNIREFLKEREVDKNKVLPLKQRCRMVILNHLCPQADLKINELHLPPLLVQYLSIPEIDCIIEMFNENKSYH